MPYQPGTRPLPYHVPVQAPAITRLPTKSTSVTQRRSNHSHLSRFTRACKTRAQLWLATAPSFTLPTVDLNQLRSRPKNTKDHIEKAQNCMKEMRTWPADACSGRWYDKNGQLVVAGFAYHINLASIRYVIKYTNKLTNPIGVSQGKC